MEVLECSVSIYNLSKVLPVMYLAPDYRLPSPIPSMISIIFNPNGNAAGKCNTILFYYTTVVSLSLCSSVCVKSVHTLLTNQKSCFTQQNLCICLEQNVEITGKNKNCLK